MFMSVDSGIQNKSLLKVNTFLTTLTATLTAAAISVICSSPSSTREMCALACADFGLVLCVTWLQQCLGYGRTIASVRSGHPNCSQTVDHGDIVCSSSFSFLSDHVKQCTCRQAWAPFSPGRSWCQASTSGRVCSAAIPVRASAQLASQDVF